MAAISRAARGRTIKADKSLTARLSPQNTPAPGVLVGQARYLFSANSFSMVAVSAAPVGADVEQVRPLHPAMARRLAQADCGDLQPFELWTLRESWFKLTGAGDLRTIPFRRTAGVLVPPEAGALCRVYDDIPGCAAAACSLAEQPPERLRFVPPREICT